MHNRQDLSDAYAKLLLEDANTQFQQGNFDDAKKIYQQVLSFNPNTPRALHGMGVTLHKQNISYEGLDYIEAALRLQPEYVDAFISQGKIHKELKEYKAAYNCFKEAYRLYPDSLDNLNDLCYVGIELKKYDEVETYLKRALSLEPDNWASLLNLGILRKRFMRFSEALDCFKKVILIKPTYIDVLGHLATIYISQGLHDLAIPFLKKALELKPDSLFGQSGLIFSKHYKSGSTQKVIFEESLAWEAMAKEINKTRQFTHLNVKADPERYLRIGLVSPDFRRHPVGYFVQSLLMLHDPDEIHIVCYSDVNDEDDLTLLLRDSSDSWRRTLGISDAQAAKMIRRDRIDILVDLAGHTNSNRLAMFITKPAPIQITWAGYVGTTGIRAIDYLISDRFQSTDDAQQYTVEQIYRMPNDYISYCPPDYAPEVSPLPALANGYITFCCFNNLSKISVDVIKLWCEILKRVKNSKLFIKNPSFTDQETISMYLNLFSEFGIAEDRIIADGKSKHLDMLHCYSNVDIQLDTLPYSGGLTTLESLWMGVPVVTLPGELFSSRHSLSHLMNVGLQFCVAKTTEEYIEIACSLAENIENLAQLRSSLRSKMAESPVCNGLEFVEDMQNAFRSMWQKWCTASANLASDENDLNEDNITPFMGDHIDWNERGNNYSNTGNFSEAIKSYKEALEIKPSYIDATYNLGIVYYKLGALEEAKRLFKKATYLDPDFIDAHLNLSNVLIHLGKNSEAIFSCNNILKIKHDYAEAYNNIGTANLNLGQPQAALLNFKKAIELRPDYAQAHSNVLYVYHFLSQSTSKQIANDSRNWNLLYAAPLFKDEAIRKKYKKKGSIRLGFVSPDFYRHPVGYFVQAFFMLHDSDKFEIYCYSDATIEDDLTGQLRDSVSVWRYISGLSDYDVTQLINDDRIDILIDLAGHSNANRLLVFAAKPAPIQVTWAGYIGTTGLSAIDYLISDFYQSPDGADEFASEKIIRLPDDYISYCPPEFAPEVSALPAILNGYVTFGVFNKMAKISNDALNLWADILKKITTARLWIQNPSLSESSVSSRLLSFFQDHGISADRLIFKGALPHRELLQQYAFVDIQLDTMPYSGGLTTLESIWMGVPVVTLPGELFSSRHSYTHLMNLGHKDWIASSCQDYVSIACNLANDIVMLSGIRSQLRQKMMDSPLCDGLNFAENLQNAFIAMWQNYLDTNEFSDEYPQDALLKTDLIISNDQVVVEHYNHGVVCVNEGRLIEAEKVFRDVISKSPVFLMAHNNLAMTIAKMGKLLEAEAVLLDVLQQHPNFFEAHNNLGNVYIGLGRSEDALVCFQKALAINPSLTSAYSNILFCMNYITRFEQKDILNASLTWRDLAAKETKPFKRNDKKNDGSNKRKKRIGYVSGDFKFHSISFFLRPLFENHDRGKFEIYCFSNVKHADAVTFELQHYVDTWIDITDMNDFEAAQIIMELEIDLLVDLSGHTAENRLGIFLYHPALVQVAWLGYPNTTGLPEMDYRLTDHVADPEGFENGYTETLFRLNTCFVCYQPPEIIPDVSPLPFDTKGFITFCSFNNVAKLTEETIALWSSILRSLPTARIILKSSNKCTEPLLNQHIISMFKNENISPDRLDILSTTDSLYAHLNKYSLADIALDTFPYNGTTTTFEALVMGVPVITFAGNRHASRVGASILTHLGEAGLVAETAKSYHNIVVELATAHKRLRTLRSGLRKKVLDSALCNGSYFVSNIEEAYTEMLAKQKTR